MRSTITFDYKDYRDESRNKEMTLDGVEFIRRYAIHVLPERFVRIRHFGYLAPATVNCWERCRRHLAKRLFQGIGSGSLGRRYVLPEDSS